MTAVNRSWIGSSAASQEIALEAALAALAPDAAQRRRQPALAVDELRVLAGTLVQMTPAVYGLAREPRTWTTPLVLDADGQAAGVGTIQGADAGTLDQHGAHVSRTMARSKEPFTRLPRDHFRHGARTRAS